MIFAAQLCARGNKSLDCFHSNCFSLPTLNFSHEDSTHLDIIYVCRHTSYDLCFYNQLSWSRRKGNSHRYHILWLRLMRFQCDPCNPEKEDDLIVMNMRLSLYHTSVKTWLDAASFARQSFASADPSIYAKDRKSSCWYWMSWTSLWLAWLSLILKCISTHQDIHYYSCVAPSSMFRQFFLYHCWFHIFNSKAVVRE